MISVGCDVGCVFVKAAVVEGDRLLGAVVAPTTGNAVQEIPGLIAEAVKRAGLSADRVDHLIATGNAGSLCRDADFTEDVITCAAAAAGYFLPSVQLAIDVGGQSITALLLNPEGDVVNFMRNDKCASGSGRFLEVIAKKLNVGLAELDRTAGQSRKTVELSSQCGVFAESEVITHVNQGETVPDILAGVCAAVARMVTAQARKFGDNRDYTLTGGVARLQAVTRIIQDKLDGRFHPFPFDPQLATAVGAALLGDSE